MFIMHEYPLSMVEHIGFRKFSSTIQSLFEVPSRNMIKSEILNIYDFEKAKTMSLDGENESRVAIPSDRWNSSNQKIGFMVVMADFIDDSWKLQSQILRLSASSSHSDPNNSKDDPLNDFDMFVSKQKRARTAYAKTAGFDYYLEEDVFPRTSGFDVLLWWKQNGLKYPTLQAVATDVLAITVYTFLPNRFLILVVD